MRGMCRLLAVACVGMLASAAFAEQVDNPQYVGWSKFKPGTTVTLKTETATKMGGNETKMTSTTTSKLVDINPNEATVETTTKMSMNGMDMPANTMPPQKIPAKVDKPAGGANGQKAEVKEGTDKVEVGGKSYNTKTTETTTDMNGTKTVSKTWMSDEVPGGLVKMESTSSGAMDSKMTMTLVEVKQP